MMKRSKDDISVKGPFVSACMDFYGGTQKKSVGEQCAERQNFNDAFKYLHEVKKAFEDQIDKTCSLMSLRISKLRELMRMESVTVKELLKGHNYLILGFNTFVPNCYETAIFEGSIFFVNSVKNHFQNDDQVYKQFLDILSMYRKEHKTINEVCHEVAALFKDHPDLLDEFYRFLPGNSAKSSKRTVELEEAISSVASEFILCKM